MKLLTIICILVLFLGPPLGTQEKGKEKKTDPLENLSLVEKVKDIPAELKTGFDSITGHDAFTYLSFISHDLFEGRDTASRGYDLAAQYIASMFSLWGIKPAGDFERPTFSGRRFSAPAATSNRKRGYFQVIPFLETVSTSSSLMVDWNSGPLHKSISFEPNVDFTYSGSGSQSFSAPVVFVGYGISEKSLKFDEYKGINAKGKIVMMLTEYPQKNNPESPFNKGELKKKYGPRPRMRRGPSTNVRVELAKKMGAVAIIYVENSPEQNGDITRNLIPRKGVFDERPIYPGVRRRLQLAESQGSRRRGSLPSIRVTRKTANQILALVGKDVDSLKNSIEKDLKSASMALSGVRFSIKTESKTKLVSCSNVLGFIEGSDPELKDEVIVIGAHLDHLGKRGDYIFNGADDNGSGSVGVMEVAQAIALNAKKPKRSIVFALWTGEEKGLLGSRYYTEHPFFPLKKTVACLNMDMISRVWTKDNAARMARMLGKSVPEDIMKKINYSDFLSLSFAADPAKLKSLLKSNNQYVGLAINLRPSKTASGGSDHAPFAQKKIPWIAFMAAMTEDYHQPSDSVSRVSKKMMQKVIRLVYLMAFSLGN